MLHTRINSGNKKGLFIWIFIVVFFLVGIFLMFSKPLIKKSAIHSRLVGVKNSMELKSNSFINYNIIPSRYTCDGKDISPNFYIKNIPKDAKELALIVTDLDAPGGVWVHWVVWGISPKVRSIDEEETPSGAMEGTTSFGDIGYSGPCPPKNTGVHRYSFVVYALKKEIYLARGASAGELRKNIDGDIIDKAEIVGLYGDSK